MLERGSEWRRWDLHVHTPNTVLNDQFGNWDLYLKAVEAHPHVKVMGVTDYMSVDNYTVLKAHKAAGRIGNIELLIPNIEFRIAPPSDKATALNIHLLISPDDPQHETEIRNALGRLAWEYQKGRYSCLPDQMKALGRAFDSEIKDDRAAMAMGVTQFKVDFTGFRDWFQAEKWLSRNSLVAVAAGDDGLSGFQRDGAWGGFREEITRFCQILFSGRPGEREFWIGQGVTEKDIETMQRMGACASGWSLIRPMSMSRCAAGRRLPARRLRCSRMGIHSMRLQLKRHEQQTPDMRGRRPKPTRMKVLTGNPGKRPMNKHEPKPESIVPDCPAELGPVARQEWDRLASELGKLKILTALDRAALAAYCGAYALWAEATEAIQKYGSMVKSPSGYPIQSPYVSIANRQAEIMMRIASEFGFTPASRSRISTPIKNEPNLFDLLGGAKTEPVPE